MSRYKAFVVARRRGAIQMATLVGLLVASGVIGVAVRRGGGDKGGTTTAQSNVALPDQEPAKRPSPAQTGVPGTGGDFCEAPTAIAGEGTFNFDNSSATTDGPANDQQREKIESQNVANDVWFCWTSPCDGDVIVSTCGLTVVDTKIAAYQGCLCPADSLSLDCNDDTCGLQSQISFPAATGDEYLIRIGTFPFTIGGPGQFSVSCPAPPAGATMALVPTGASGVPEIDWQLGPGPNEITLFSLDQDVATELRISGWAPQLVAAYQASLDCTGFASGAQGTLIPSAAPCGFADGFESCLGVDENRPDYMFFGVPVIAVCSSVNLCPDGTPGFMLCASASLFGAGADEANFPSGAYGATFGVHVPVDAQGTFAFGIDPDANTTVLNDEKGLPIPIGTFDPAIITIAAGSICDGLTGDCCVANGTPGCDNPACCESVCKVDAFCCDAQWDQLCAEQTTKLCPTHCDGPPTGACCASADSCTDGVLPSDCVGTYMGDGSTCVDVVCPECIDDEDCDDGNACTVDTCDLTTGCINTDITKPGFCCNPLDGTNIPIDDGDPCTDDFCDVSTGEVLHKPGPAGTPCDDGLPCTAGDACDGGGSCSGQDVNNLPCADNNDCFPGICLDNVCVCPIPLVGCCQLGGVCTTTTSDACGLANGTAIISGCLGDNDDSGFDDACEPSEPCEDCGPGLHWVDACQAGRDFMPTAALVGIDTDLDCIADTSLVLSGMATVDRSDPHDTSWHFPLGAPDEHMDVIDTVMQFMSLSGGGVTLIAGGGQGEGGTLAPTYGVIVEQETDASIARSLFAVYFQIDLGDGTLLYNQQALQPESKINCVPPAAEYIHPMGCTPLYTSPIPGEGVLVANLVSANHDSFPSCGSPAAGDCLVNNGTPYCDDTTCCETICKRPGLEHCCDVVWDAACATEAQQTCIPAGDDCWTTPCGATVYDFCLRPLAAGFFGENSDPFDGTVLLGGGDTSEPDTVLTRLDTLILDGVPATDSVGLELVKLSLIGCGPITVTYFGGNKPQQWDVSVTLSDQGAEVPTGLMTVDRGHENGGTFSAQFFVQPVFVFTEVGNPGNVRVVDFGAEGDDPVPFETIADGSWVHTLSDNIPHVPCGSNFVPGVTEDPDTLEQCCTETCHANPGGGHQHCNMQCSVCPRGACCLSDGTCDLVEATANQTAEEVCLDSGGQEYKGDGTVCEDIDGDGIADRFETNDCCAENRDVCNTGTDPRLADTDGDGADDGLELYVCGTDPCVPDETDCNGNGMPDACDIATGASPDANENGVPDECDSPAALIPEPGPSCTSDLDCVNKAQCISGMCYTPKNRYTSFSYDGLNRLVMIRVTSPDCGGFIGWVDTPNANGLARLSATPVCLDPATAPPLTNLADQELMPDRTYVLEAVDCDDPGLISPLLALPSTHLWGDIVGPFDPETESWSPPNNTVNLEDVFAAVMAFQGVPSAPSLSAADVEPSVPNGVVNLADAFQIVLAFQGAEYPFEGFKDCTTRDCFESTGQATVTLDLADVTCANGVEMDLASGILDSSIVELDQPPYATGVDIVTELTRLEVAGNDPNIGDVIIRERTDRVSAGLIENVQADGGGGFIEGDSSFDIFLTVELVDLGVTLDTGNSTLRLEAGTITELPPLNSDYLPPPMSPPVPLFTEGTTTQVGWLCHAKHTPTTETPCPPAAGHAEEYCIYQATCVGTNCSDCQVDEGDRCFGSASPCSSGGGTCPTGGVLRRRCGSPDCCIELRPDGCRVLDGEPPCPLSEDSCDVCDGPKGACCDDLGICKLLTATECENADGNYLGTGTTCTPLPGEQYRCPQPVLIYEVHCITGSDCDMCDVDSVGDECIWKECPECGDCGYAVNPEELTRQCDGLDCCVEYKHKECRLPDGEVLCPEGPLCGPLSLTNGNIICAPANCMPCEGDDITLTVMVAGLDPITYQWRRDGVDIGGATGDSYTINNATPANANGSYTVAVMNQCTPPNMPLIVGPKQVTVDTNRSITVECEDFAKQGLVTTGGTLEVVAEGHMMTGKAFPNNCNYGPMEPSWTATGAPAGDGTQYDFNVPGPFVAPGIILYPVITKTVDVDCTFPTGDTKSATVEVYPDVQRSVTFDLPGPVKNLENKLKQIETLSKVFKFKGIDFALTYENQWKERHGGSTFTFLAFKAGFAGSTGLEVRVPLFALKKLGVPSAVLDLGVFLWISGDLEAFIGINRDIDEANVYVFGPWGNMTVNISVAIGAEANLLGGFIGGSLRGRTGITGTATISSTVDPPQADLQWDVSWDGLHVDYTIEALWGLWDTDGSFELIHGASFTSGQLQIIPWD